MWVSSDWAAFFGVNPLVILVNRPFFRDGSVFYACVVKEQVPILGQKETKPPRLCCSIKGLEKLYFCRKAGFNDLT